MTAYYNEFDPKAAAWLRELISAGHIAPGDVDERSIADVRPADLNGYTQCHFFAGIGVWSYALRRSGWPDSRPVWTGSCPCQPFSAAGKGGGFDDERHLWPHFHYLIRECKPPVAAGEQVASKDGLAWLDLVQADMEGTAYAFGALDFCSAGVGAPHIRPRLYWLGELADADGRDAGTERQQRRREHRQQQENGSFSGVADDDDDGLQGCAVEDLRGTGRREEGPEIGRVDAPRLERLADDEGFGRREQRPYATGRGERGPPERMEQRLGRGGVLADLGRAGPTNGFWRDADWLHCRDHKWRPVEPGTFPLAHGAPARVGRLRGYGNAINAEAAQAFIEAYLETKAVEHFRLTEVLEDANNIDGQEGIFG